MKSKIIALSLVALSTMSFTSFAQDNKRACVSQTTCVNTPDCMNQECGPACPFAGLNLTDAQRTQLRDLEKKQTDSRREARELRKADKRANDSIMRAERQEARRAYLKQVKEIVGPENYVTFLENSYINGNLNGKIKYRKDDRMFKRDGEKAKMKIGGELKAKKRKENKEK